MSHDSNEFYVKRFAFLFYCLFLFVVFVVVFGVVVALRGGAIA